jgi:hypothetical protein
MVGHIVLMPKYLPADRTAVLHPGTAFLLIGVLAGEVLLTINRTVKKR